MKKLFLFATVAAAGLFASCSSTDDTLGDGNPAIGNVDGDRAAIKIGIANVANTETRGTGTVGGVGTGPNAWAGQRINVFMFDKGTFDLALEDPTNANSAMYNDREMITPGTSENKIIPSAVDNSNGEAMNADASIKYYPATGNFDFFGYHGDDATGAVTTNEVADDPATTDVDESAEATQWLVPFTINGSQDLMSTKAALTANDATLMGTSTDYYSAKAARKGVQPTLTFDHLLTRLAFQLIAGNKESAGHGVGYEVETYKPKATITNTQYDAWSSTNVVAATYWTVSAGDATVYEANDAVTIAAADFASLAEADKALFLENTYKNGYDANRAVMVEEIQVKSKTTGKMLVAWKADQEVAVDPNDASKGTYMPGYKKIVWDANPNNTWLTLKDRAFAKLQDGESIAAGTDYDAAAAPAALTTLTTKLASLNTKKTDLNDKKTDLNAELALLDPQSAEYTAKEAEIAEVDQEIAEVDQEIALATADQTNFWTTISEATYNSLNGTGQGKYDLLNADNINANLVPLTPTAPTATVDWATNPATFTATPTPIGEAMIIAPNEYDANGDVIPAALEMQVKISQKVPTNWNQPRTYEYMSQTYTLPIPLPKVSGVESAFKINNSYTVKLTVYGFSRIDVIAVVNDWLSGEERHVGGDDDND